MRSLSGILAFTLAVLSVAAPSYASVPKSAMDNCCCTVQKQEDSCCASPEPAPVSDHESDCTCHIELPNQPANKTEAVLVPVRSDVSKDLLPVAVITEGFHSDSEKVSHYRVNHDAGPPGRTVPVRILICSLLN